MRVPEDPLHPPAPRQFVTLRDRIVYLRSLEDFRGVPMESIAFMAQLMEEERVPGGTVLVAKGKPITRSYFLVEGKVGLHKDGKRVGELVPPQAVAAIGVLARIDGPPGDIVVEEDALLLCIDASTLHRALEADFGLLSNTLRSITRLILSVRRGLPFDPANMPPADPGSYPDRPLDFVDRLEFSVESNGPTSMEAMGEMARHQQEVRIREGELVWELGDHADHYITVFAGLLEVENGWGHGTIGRGYTLGFFDCIAEVPRGYRARAATDMVLLRGESAALWDVFEDQFELAQSVVAMQAVMAVDHLWNARFHNEPD